MARRLATTLAAVAALSGLSVMALPLAASADVDEEDHGYELSFDPAPSEQGLEGPVRLLADVSDEGRIDEWRVEIRSDDAARPGFGVLCQGGPANDLVIDCPWETRMYPNGAPSVNGGYIVHVWVKKPALLGLSSAEHEGHTPVTLANGPVAPISVTATYEAARGEVTVRWAANPEPDVAGYVVEESEDGRGFDPVGESETTSLRQAVSHPGDYRYRVAARRRAGSAVLQGPWAEAGVTVAALDSAPPTTAPGSGGGPVDDLGVEEPVNVPAPAPAGAPSSTAGTTSAPSGGSSRSSASGRTAATASRGTTTGPTTPARRPAAAPEEPDPGYSERLPYRAPAAPRVPIAVPGGDVAMSAPVLLPAEGSATAGREGPPLPPMAGGLLLFVVAMTMIFVMRRPSRTAPAGAAEGLSDWTNF